MIYSLKSAVAIPWMWYPEQILLWCSGLARALSYHEYLLSVIFVPLLLLFPLTGSAKEGSRVRGCEGGYG